MRKCFVAIVILTMFLSACVTTAPTADIEIATEVNSKANITGYSSYAWLGSAAIVNDRNGRWEPPQFDADAEIKFLIDRKLRARGMSEDSIDPDVIVVFAAGIDMESIDLDIDTATNLAVMENVPLGALLVILVDARSGDAIWGGRATGEIQENSSQQVIKKRLDFAVTNMFSRLPK